GTTDGLISSFHKKSLGKAFTADLIPQYRVRQLDRNTPSSPVRTPSFMPKLLVQWLWATHKQKPQTGIVLVDQLTIFIQEVQFTVGHYSNGQDGCFLASQRPDTLDDNHCKR